jgi:mannose-1-phosphate guanylyltransferase
MQAVVLVGGQGTRLQPLTLTTPKPLVPLANRPLIEHVVRWLEGAGITQVILATQYHAAAFERWMHDWRGVEVVAVEEPVPLGTAGAVANVAHLLRGTTAIINGDNVTNIDLGAMLELHQHMGACATIAVASVDDPTGRGVAVMDGDGRLRGFQEKPAPGMALARTVNTGTYLIEPSALDIVPAGRRAMWETDVFPALIAGGKTLVGCTAPHLWLDAGTPAGYFATQDAILQGRVSAPDGTVVSAPDTHEGWTPPVAIGRDAGIASTARLDGPVSIGHGCTVQGGARIGHSAIWDACVVEQGATIHGSIIGYNTRIAAGATIADALIGDGTTIGAGVHIPAGSRIAPGSTITAEHPRSNIVKSR